MEATESSTVDRGRVLGFALSCAILHALGALALFFCLVYVVPQFVQMFKEQGGPLPQVTVIALDASAFACQYWYAVLPVLALLTFVDFKIFVGLWSRRRNVLAWRWFYGLASLEGLAFLWLVVALFLPMIEPIQQMPR